MAKTVLIDELHITLRVPANLTDRNRETVCATLTDDEFLARLRRAIRNVLRTYPELTRVRATLTR